MESVHVTACDRKGRLYLKESLRQRFGAQFIIVESADGLKLLPVSRDPLASLREQGKRLHGRSIDEIKRRIRARAAREARK